MPAAGVALDFAHDVASGRIRVGPLGCLAADPEATVPKCLLAQDNSNMLHHQSSFPHLSSSSALLPARLGQQAITDNTAQKADVWGEAERFPTDRVADTAAACLLTAAGNCYWRPTRQVADTGAAYLLTATGYRYCGSALTLKSMSAL